MELSNDIEIQNASALDLRPKDNRFKYEINLGLALPTKFRMDKNYDLEREHESLVKSVDENGSVAMIKIKTQSKLGPLAGFDNDVLTVLLTMAYEQKEYNEKNYSKQNGYRVYYTHYEICRRLGLNVGSAGYVAESIEKIASQNLTLNNFAYTANDKKALKKDEETKIILKKGKVSLADGSSNADEYTSYFYIEFDHFVVRNLYNDYVSVLNSNKYLSLTTGPSRRIFVFLSSKRKMFGDRFTFDLFELSKVLGIYETKPFRQREYIGKYLTKVTKEITTLNFMIEKVRGKNSWTILVNFEGKELVEVSRDPFYDGLVRFYSEDSLEKLNLLEVDFINYKEEFESKYRSIKGSIDFYFQKQLINPAEFAIDIALFQVIKKRYPVTRSFKALAKTILVSLTDGMFELPDGYRYFLYKRLADIQKKKDKAMLEREKERQNLLRETERRKLEKAFNNFFRDIVQKNKRQMNIYREKAIEMIEDEGVGQEDMMYNLLVESRIELLAKEDFDRGDVMSLARNDGSLLLS